MTRATSLPDELSFDIDSGESLLEAGLLPSVVQRFHRGPWRDLPLAP